MIRFIFALLSVIVIIPITYSQNVRSRDKHGQAPKIQLIEVNKGNYHKISDTQNLTPIEEIMKSANFCEIDGYNILVPNCSSEPNGRDKKPLKEKDISHIFMLLNGDTLRYFDLENVYNTPLKIKRFKESQEFKDLALRFSQERSCIINGTFYAISDVNSQFDLENGTFTIHTPFAYGGRLRLNSSDLHFEYNKFTTERIDEDTAYKIETNPSEIVVFMKFTNKFDYDDCICEPTRVCIADKKTGEIYYEYTPQKEVQETNDEPQSPTPKPTERVERDYKNKPRDEKQAVFEDDGRKIYKQITDNLKICKHCEKRELTMKLRIEYKVLEDCSIGDIRFESTGCTKQDSYIRNAIKCIKVISPAMVDGKPVKANYFTRLNLML